MTAQKTDLPFLKSLLRPVVTDGRDEAFRARIIRVTLAIMLVMGALSFASVLFVFKSSWALISFPSIHIFVLAAGFVSLVLLSRRHISESGALLVITTVVSGSGLILLNDPDAALLNFATAFSTYMLATLIAALVLPRNLILPTGITCVAIYTAIGISLSYPELVTAHLTPLGIGILTESIFLRQLRIEFDSRLEQVETEKQNAESARQRAEAADRSKSGFLANMSHELRTPLNAIIGYDEAMIGGMVGEFAPEQLRLLKNIQVNSRRLLGLINDILDLSKIESGSLEVYLAPCEPRKVIQEIVESLRSLVQDKKIALELDFADDVPEVVLTDTKKLQQILVNLLSNAIKFTSKGGVFVVVNNVDHGCWQIKVKDSGIGMPANAVSYIFEPFRQVDGTETRKHKGTGLGLAITKKLVDHLGGEIIVETEPGSGSTFIVKLPRANVPETQVS